MLGKENGGNSLQDYHLHAMAHGEYYYTEEWIGQFARQAVQQNLREIGFAEHDEFYHLMDFEVLSRVQEAFPALKIRSGLEVDYVPGREKKIEEITEFWNFDYVIGSVHFIEGWPFDHPDYRDGFGKMDIDEVYRAYFSLLEQMVCSGLFDIVGHLDLIKKWGHRPLQNTVLSHAQKVLEYVKDAGLAIEINSAGLRKPVQEMYPGPEIMGKMGFMGIPVTLASDAHHPSETGAGLLQARQMLYQAGYREITCFSGRKQWQVPL